jgi:hypothetical protein
VSQLWIPKGERFGLLTRTAATESVLKDEDLLLRSRLCINSTKVFFEMHFEFARGVRMLVIKLIHLEGLLLVPLSETRSIRIYGRPPASVLSTGQQRCAISS